MTPTLSDAQETLPEDLARRLEEIAAARGLSPVEVVRRHFQSSEPPAPESGQKEASGERRIWRAPQSLDELGPRVPPPPGMTAMEYIAGKWPGDETEEELLATLKEMDTPRPSRQELSEQLRAWRTPQSREELKPHNPAPPGMTAMQFIRGHWPGDETDTDEEILAALKEMG